MNLVVQDTESEPTDDRHEARLTGKRLALLICNVMYPKIAGYHDIVGAAQDADRVEEILSDSESCRFTVCALIDGGLLEVRRAIERICREATERDTLLIYFSAGSRTGNDDSLYLLVNDSEGDLLNATALDTEFVLSQLRATRCRKIVLIADTCYSGAFFNNNRGIPNGLCALTSCGATENSLDTPAGGPFSIALCDGLRSQAADQDGDGMVSVDELYEFIKARLQADGSPTSPQKWVWNLPEPIYVTNVPRHVFLSYSRKDCEQALKLKAAMEAEGITVWIDLEGMLSGDWQNRVTESLNRSRAVVVLLTRNSLKSESPVRKELAFAASKKVPIIPVHVGALRVRSLPSWFEFAYGGVHRHKLEAESYGADVKKLVFAIRRLRPTKKKQSALKNKKANLTR